MNGNGWSGHDTLFVALVMVFGILAAAVGLAAGAPEHTSDAVRPAGHESCSTAITGGIGSPFPTGCR